jgi:hypothetical protein
MIFSKRNLFGRCLQLHQSPDFETDTRAALDGSSTDRKMARTKANANRKRKKPKPKKYTGPKSQRNKPTSLAEGQINPAFGLPAVALVSGALRRPPVGAQSIVPRNVNNALSGLDFAKDIANKVGGTAAAATSAVDAIKAFDKATGVSERIKNRKPKGDKGDGGGNGGGGSKTNLSSSSGGISYDMMCNKPISQKIEIATGVRSGLIVNPGERNNEEDFSSLYIMSGNLFKEDAIDTAFKDHLEKNIFPDVNREIQYNLNFDYELPLTDFTNWFYDLTKALEVYYALDSVQVYGMKEENNNPGSRYLLTKINSSIRLKLNELRRVLNYQAIPPRLLQTVRYMYQYYKFSELPGAPLYRLSPGFIFHEHANSGNDAYKHSLSVGMLDDLISKLTSHSSVHNKIFKAMPSWHVDGYCMPPSCDTAYYDPSFRTFWFNSCLTYKHAENVIYTQSGGDTSNFRYWLYTNNFDGLFFAMGSFNKTNETGSRPGLWTPSIDYSGFPSNYVGQMMNTSCYHDGDTVEAISQPSSTYGRALQFDNKLTPYKNSTDNNIYVAHNQDGSTQVAQECTFRTYRQAVWDVTEWLFRTS